MVARATLLLSALLLAASATGAAQTKAERVAADLSLKETAIARILDARAGFFADVEIDIFSGVALLTGRVATVREKAQATALVRSVPGIRTVTNEIQVGAVGDVKRMTNDLILERQIRKEMRAVFGKRMPRLSWRATNGVVYVFGHARTEWEHNRTLALVRSIQGAARVVDLLRITTADG